MFLNGLSHLKCLKIFNYHLFFNNLDLEYHYDDSDDDSVVDSYDYSNYIKILKFISWFNIYSSCKEHENKTHKEYKKDR